MRFWGNAGDDTLEGGAGADLLQGQDGADWASYVDLGRRGFRPFMGRRRGRRPWRLGAIYLLGGIEKPFRGQATMTTGWSGIGGANPASPLGGRGGDDDYLGQRGRRHARRRRGAATPLRGQDGSDTASYAGSPAGVTVRLWAGDWLGGGHATGDRLVGGFYLFWGDIENAEGLPPIGTTFFREAAGPIPSPGLPAATRSGPGKVMTR